MGDLTPLLERAHWSGLESPFPPVAPRPVKSVYERAGFEVNKNVSPQASSPRKVRSTVSQNSLASRYTSSSSPRPPYAQSPATPSTPSSARFATSTTSLPTGSSEYGGTRPPPLKEFLPPTKNHPSMHTQHSAPDLTRMLKSQDSMPLSVSPLSPKPQHHPGPSGHPPPVPPFPSFARVDHKAPTPPLPYYQTRGQPHQNLQNHQNHQKHAPRLSATSVANLSSSLTPDHAPNAQHHHNNQYSRGPTLSMATSSATASLASHASSGPPSDIPSVTPGFLQVFKSTSIKHKHSKKNLQIDTAAAANSQDPRKPNHFKYGTRHKQGAGSLASIVSDPEFIGSSLINQPSPVTTNPPAHSTAGAGYLRSSPPPPNSKSSHFPASPHTHSSDHAPGIPERRRSSTSFRGSNNNNLSALQEKHSSRPRLKSSDIQVTSPVSIDGLKPWRPDSKREPFQFDEEPSPSPRLGPPGRPSSAASSNYSEYTPLDAMTPPQTLKPGSITSPLGVTSNMTSSQALHSRMDEYESQALRHADKPPPIPEKKPRNASQSSSHSSSRSSTMSRQSLNSQNVLTSEPNSPELVSQEQAKPAEAAASRLHHKKMAFGDSVTPLFKNDTPPAVPEIPPKVSARRVCRGCGTRITGKAVASSDGSIPGKWHRECFKCQGCGSGFSSGTFYVHKDLPFCKKCYHVENMSVCNSCGEGIEGPCLETMASTLDGNSHSVRHHPDCLKCVRCDAPVTSEEYYNVDDELLCADHFNSLHLESSSSKVEKRRTRLMML